MNVCTHVIISKHYSTMCICSMDLENITTGCQELSLNLALLAQGFEHPMVICSGPTKQTLHNLQVLQLLMVRCTCRLQNVAKSWKNSWLSRPNMLLSSKCFESLRPLSISNQNSCKNRYKGIGQFKTIMEEHNMLNKNNMGHNRMKCTVFGIIRIPQN